jgi:molecular chaperone GrpE (heat shock protein)
MAKQKKDVAGRVFLFQGKRLVLNKQISLGETLYLEQHWKISVPYQTPSYIKLGQDPKNSSIGLIWESDKHPYFHPAKELWPFSPFTNGDSGWRVIFWPNETQTVSSDEHDDEELVENAQKSNPKITINQSTNQLTDDSKEYETLDWEKILPALDVVDAKTDTSSIEDIVKKLQSILRQANNEILSTFKGVHQKPYIDLVSRIRELDVMLAHMGKEQRKGKFFENLIVLRRRFSDTLVKFGITEIVPQKQDSFDDRIHKSYNGKKVFIIENCILPGFGVVREDGNYDVLLEASVD